MQEVIDWIIESITFIDLVQVLATVVIAFATFVLWLATRNLARVSKRAPFVVCSLGPSQTIANELNAIIINTGNATAFDIEVHFEADTESPKNKKELILNFSLLTPGQILRPDSNLEGWETQTKIYVTITWALKPTRRKQNKQKPLKYIIDDSDKNERGSSENGLKNITKELGGIRRLIEDQNRATWRRDERNK